jgi:hypothetical protein
MRAGRFTASTNGGFRPGAEYCKGIKASAAYPVEQLYLAVAITLLPVLPALLRRAAHAPPAQRVGLGGNHRLTSSLTPLFSPCAPVP